MPDYIAVKIYSLKRGHLAESNWSYLFFKIAYFLHKTAPKQWHLDTLMDIFIVPFKSELWLGMLAALFL